MFVLRDQRSGTCSLEYAIADFVPSSKKQGHDQSWSCLRIALQILIRVESIVTCL